MVRLGGSILHRELRKAKEAATISARFARVCALACTLALILFASSAAFADVGVVLNESLDTSVARITGSGHSAVYFSRICPETPVKVRLCRPGEEGSIISNYTTLGEDQPFEWNAVPLSMFLYGVEDPSNRPLFGSEKFKHALEERYREKYLKGLCESKTCRTSNSAEWREMVGATMERSLYIFIINTTVEQDEKLIEELNSQPNVNHFNGVTRNCATFTQRWINSYYPHATSANYLNDFGMTSPKAIARSFTRYAGKHPETELRVLHFAQLPGTYKRSTVCREGTEQLYRSKKLLVPMVLFADHELPFVAASYIFTGRFSPEKTWEEYPSAEANGIRAQLREAKAAQDENRADDLEAAMSEETARILGTSKQWKEYRKKLDAMTVDAVHSEIVSRRGSLDQILKRLDKEGSFHAESNGGVWLELPNPDGAVHLGASASNVLAPSSDPYLGFEMLLVRATRIAQSPKHSRESMIEFQADWEFLEKARTRLAGQFLTTAKETPPVRRTNLTGRGSD